MKRKLFSFSLLLLPAMLSAAVLQSVSGQLSYQTYNPTYKNLKGEYDTASKTLTITNFIGSQGQVYGEASEYGLVFNNVIDGEKCSALSNFTDATHTYFYTSSSQKGVQAGFNGIASITNNTIVISWGAYEPGWSTPNFNITSTSGDTAPGTAQVPQWQFTFTFPENLDEVIGTLSLTASLENITTNAADLKYDLDWIGGMAPDGLGKYTVTVEGSNGFTTASASDTQTSGTIPLTNLQYATPYIFTVKASVAASGENYPSNEVTLQLEPTIGGDMTLSITAPETTDSDQVTIDYRISGDNVSAGTPVTINIIGDNGFTTVSEPTTTATGTITLTGLQAAKSYAFAAQASADVGNGNYLFSPVQLFSVTTEGDNPLVLETPTVDPGKTSATISGNVITPQNLDPSTPVKVYYFPTPSEE